MPNRPLLPPADAATLERAFSLINEAIYTIALQRRRLRSTEPEDKTFVLRWWADLQFFIVALRRLRQTAKLASRVPGVRGRLSAAIKQFDTALPMLPVMRNVGEHIDDYALDSERRHHKQIGRHLLQVGEWDGRIFKWLNATLDIDEACIAAEELYKAVSSANKRRTRSKRREFLIPPKGPGRKPTTP